MKVVCYLTRKLHYLLHESLKTFLWVTYYLAIIWKYYRIKTLGRKKNPNKSFLIGLNSNMLVYNQF